MRKVAIWGQLCEIATSQNIRSPVSLRIVERGYGNKLRGGFIGLVRTPALACSLCSHTAELLKRTQMSVYRLGCTWNTDWKKHLLGISIPARSARVGNKSTNSTSALDALPADCMPFKSLSLLSVKPGICTIRGTLVATRKLLYFAHSKCSPKAQPWKLNSGIYYLILSSRVVSSKQPP